MALALLGLVVLILSYADRIMGMPGRSHSGPLPPLTPEEADLRDRLRAHVRHLAETIGERSVWRPADYEAAAAYIEGALRQGGLAALDQWFTASGARVRNIEAQLTGTSLAGEVLVIGAHYDSVLGTPGANDNASGVAGMLEIARLLAQQRFPRTVRFVAFANEEPPFFRTEEMGSFQYARRSRERGEKIVGMVSLETIGYYSDERGSQHYPPILGLFFPKAGNFIGFAGNTRSRAFVRQCIGAFRRHARFPSEGIAAPEAVSEVGWSDHWAFWQFGYAGLMVTDTAPFRYPHYHTAQDTPEQVDYERTARVVAGLARMVEDLAEAP